MYITGLDNLIGGDAAPAYNVISANGGAGVWIEGDGATGDLVQGNAIGPDAGGFNGQMGNALGGVYINCASSNTISSNHIAFNVHNGVTVVDGTGNTISQNSTHDHADLGIDIGDDGVTDYNLPVIDSAWSVPGVGTFVQGYLLATPLTTYTLEFFANRAANPSGYGEGEIYLGTGSVTTNPDGFGDFQFPFDLVVPPGYCVSATATDPDGTTWEFSLCTPVEGATAPGRGRDALILATRGLQELRANNLVAAMQPSQPACDSLFAAEGTNGDTWAFSRAKAPKLILAHGHQRAPDVPRDWFLLSATVLDVDSWRGTAGAS